MLIDTFKRKIDYLRVSLTKQCNFRCQYCMPDTPDDFFDNTALELPKLLEFIKIAIDNGIAKIRITGGEPLLRADIAEFIAGIYAHKPSIEIALTTNGFLLEKFAKSLKAAGLKRINVSLDSLKPERIKAISKRDALPQILRGIESAQNVGLGVKLNMVALSQTRDEICDMLEFGRARGILVRFIEFMENTHANSTLISLDSKQILEATTTTISNKSYIPYGISPFSALKNAVVVGYFGDERSYYLDKNLVSVVYHMGLDLASVRNAPIFASNGGVVILRQYLGLHGNTAVIYHGFGLSSLYAHMSDSTLKVGDEIESGDIIGYTGSSGWAFGDHLHLEILVQGHAVSVQEWSNPKWVQESINAVFEQARARLLEQNMLREQAK